MMQFRPPASPGRIRFRLCAPIAAVAAFALSVLASHPASAAINHPLLFGTKEIASGNLKMFPKWRGAVERFQSELGRCDSKICKSKSWRALIDRLRDKDLKTQLREVHREYNKRRYIVDPVNWNLPDYWATPFQFIRKNGDCEDYAIAKYMALKELGVSVEDMRIVVLQDLNLQLAHAVLVVYADDAAYVLDNQISTVVPASSIRHYQPVYSINEEGWWLHRS